MEAQSEQTEPPPEPVGAGPMLRLEDVHKRFGDLHVLKGIDLSVERGQVVCVIGPSGSGKSTLLRCMIGSIRPEAGRVLLFGQDTCSLDEERMDEVRKRFGILFQSGALFNSMTVAENVALPLE